MFECSLLKKIEECKESEDSTKRLLKVVGEVYKVVKPKLKSIKNLFEDYTDHGIEHSKSLIEAFESLVIGKDRLKDGKWNEDRLILDKDCHLTLKEVILLVLGALVHDIGMSPDIDNESNKKAKRKLEELKNTFNEERREKLKRELEELKEKIRRNHHEISKRFIENDSGLREIFDRHGFPLLREMLAYIVEGHRVNISDIFQRYKTIRDVRVSLLAFLLQIADDMDIGFKRVEDIVEDSRWINADVEGLKHLFANLSVEKKRVGGEVIYSVYLRDVEKEAEVLRLLVEWNGKIEKKLERAKLYGGEVIRSWRGVLPSRVVFKAESTKYDFDLSKRFEVDRELFAKALSSDVYENFWEYAFRELISNAFDAIKWRAHKYGDFNPKVEIDIKLDGEWYEITIEDSGIGMSRDEVEDYLLTVGRSFYRELIEKGEEVVEGISPVGYYGIGFLSSFMLIMDDEGERIEGSIEVETKKADSDAVRVEIIDPNLPVIFSRSNRENVGTRIKIKGKREEVKEFFEKFLRKVEIEKKKDFPFADHIACSVFKSIEIPIIVRINDVVVWNECIKPETFIIGEKIVGVEVKDKSCLYKLEIWKGKNIWRFDEDQSFGFVNVNGMKCDASGFFKVFDISKINEYPIIWILNLDGNVNFTDLEKSEVKIPKEVVGKLFRKLEENEIILDFVDLPIGFPIGHLGYICDKDFNKIGAFGFIKKCLRFKDYYGEWVTLEEIEKSGKTPVVVPGDKFFEKFKDFWRKRGFHPLKSAYFEFLTTYRLFFEKCEECDWCGRGYKIKDDEFRNLLLDKLGNVVYIDIDYNIYYGDIDYNFITDNPFAKQMCKLRKEWMEKIWKLDREIYFKFKDKGYATIEDIKKLAEENEGIREIYEMIIRKK